MPNQEQTDQPASEVALSLLQASDRPLEEMGAHATTDHVIRVKRDFSEVASRTPVILTPKPLDLTGVPAEEHAGRIQAYQETLTKCQRDYEQRMHNRNVAQELEHQGQQLILAALGREYPQWNGAQLSEIWSEAWDQGHSAGHHEVLLIFGRVAEFASRLVKAGEAQ